MDDEKFLNQFKIYDPANQSNLPNIKFIPFSPLNPISKDISIFANSQDIGLDGNWTKLNSFYEKITELTCDYVGDIKCIDTFYNKKLNAQS